MRSLTFIVNPASGHPWSAKRRQMHRCLRGILPHQAEVLWTEHRQQATDWARIRAHDANRVVIAVGGDGTVHEVALGLLGGVAALGVLPVGSGNDFATMLAPVPDFAKMSPEALLSHFQTTRPTPVDVARVRIRHKEGHETSEAFINSLGLGLEGAVAGTVTRLRSIKGLSRYVIATLWQLIRYRAIEMKVQSPCGAVFEQIADPKLLVAIGNGKRAGGGFLLQPNASIHDGQLDMCWAGGLPLWRALMILPTVFWGGHGRFDEIHQATIKAITIDCPSGTPVHVDGEWVASEATRLDIDLAAGALNVVGAG